MECKNAEKLKYIFGIFNKILIEIQDIVCYNTEKSKRLYFYRWIKIYIANTNPRIRKTCFRKMGNKYE